MVMDKRSEQLQHLTEIRSMMERSSRFISLSGLSGVAAGIIAILGVAVTYMYLGTSPFDRHTIEVMQDPNYVNWGYGVLTFLIGIALIVFGLAAVFGMYFTYKATHKRGQTLWRSSSKRVLANGMLPLITGGIFCLALILKGHIELLLPSSLIFYGLACINSSKYTLNDILYMGIIEVVLGCIGLFHTDFGLELWALGFGVLHIVYGAIMYKKYEGNTAQ